MSRGTPTWLMLLPVLALAGGCRRGAGAMKPGREAVPGSEVQRMVVERVAREKEIATKLCGVPALGIGSVQALIVGNIGNSGTISVRGSPVLAPDVDVDEVDDAGVVPCGGVLAYVVAPELDGEGARVGWKLEKLEVESVDKKWDPSKPRGHHHHHH